MHPPLLLNLATADDGGVQAMVGPENMEYMMQFACKQDGRCADQLLSASSHAIG